MLRTGLLLVDIQNDYFPGGKMELVGSPQAAQAAARLLYTFRQWRLPVIFMQHVSLRPGATFFLPDTPGVEIHTSIRPHADETIFTKHYPNSFRDTGLLTYLHEQQVDRLVVAGMMTHMCVDATVRAAVDFGFECLVAHDACATRQLSFGTHTVSAADVHASFLAALHGAYGRVMTVADIIEALG